MSLYVRDPGSIPEETARIAHAACPKGTLALRLRDELGAVYHDEYFVSLYPVEGQHAYQPWRLAIVTVLQYVDGLTDRQFARYSHRIENYRLPKSENQRTALAEQIGKDGLVLLHALAQSGAPSELQEVTSVHTLKRIWQQYYEVAEGSANWRTDPKDVEGDGIIRSPYDPEARTGRKRETAWLGYKVHLTETCGVDETGNAQASTAPQLIVQVQTTVANVQDVEMTASIQKDLAQRHLLPEEQMVDTGYVDADLLVSSRQDYGITLVGPVLADNSWQKKAGKGFDSAHFPINWPEQTASCPQGHISQSFRHLGERVEIVFAKQICAACPVRSDCTKYVSSGRVLHVRPQAAYEALQKRREEQETPAFRQAYQARAGIEGTISQAVRRMEIRRARYDGLRKTQLQQVLTAVAIDIVRIDALLTQTPRGKTRRSSFMRLAMHPRWDDQQAA